MDITKYRRSVVWVMGFMFVVVMMQLAAPFMIGALVYSVSVVLPLAGYYYLMSKRWKIPMEQVNQRKASGKEEAYEDLHADDPVSSEKVTDISSCNTRTWYEEHGRERILTIMKQLDLRHISSFTIQKDGLCMARYQKGYRRCGVLPGYREVSEIPFIILLRDEGFYVERRDPFLCLSWGVERSMAA